MAPELQKRTMFAMETGDVNCKFDDDGRVKRTGTWLTASAHIITAVIGSGVLSLAWALAQLGWIVGPLALSTFSVITWYTSTLLADSYRAIKRSNCFHKNGHEAGCHTTNNMFMIIFGVTEIILSQIPNFHELSGLSIIAAIMSFAYSLIGLGLSIAKIAGGDTGKTSIEGVIIGVDVTMAKKLWNSLQAIGNIAFAYAFGNSAPGNFLTGFGFYEPFWLVDIANLCIVIHLVGAYQVFCQPTFRSVENWCSQRWEESEFVTKEYAINIPICGSYNVNMFRLIWRTLYVTATTVIAMLFPFFNSVLGLLGAASFWPLAVYFPIEMYVSRVKIKRFSMVWIWLKVLVGVCFVVSLLAAVGSIEGIVMDVRAYKPFNSIS
ncbi:hypothetical protein EZV62_011043 [Acer yangbiense]|uniref:Amino acid transporter transmembrane domain-containing protein n=1 Tax=Acer yangbiense TaxID=1000413 RepID=A0A5C7I599_9ROSI|nr:hypothetical protein EZV62_011043 [Acer yangbiense]